MLASWSCKGLTVHSAGLDGNTASIARVQRVADGVRIARLHRHWNVATVLAHFRSKFFHENLEERVDRSKIVGRMNATSFCGPVMMTEIEIFILCIESFYARIPIVTCRFTGTSIDTSTWWFAFSCS